MKEQVLPHMYFVCGTPRSGIDLMLDFLSVPRNAGWIPEKLAADPEHLSLASRVHFQNWFLLGEFFLERRQEWKRLPVPATDGRFLAHYLSGFHSDSEPPCIPGADQVTDAERERLQEVVVEIADRQRRNNLVMGYEGFPRVRMLRSIFPKAKFIHTIRDPRSVAYQMIRKSQKMDRSFLEERKKYISLMPRILQERLESLKETPIAFCGVYTRWMHDLYKQELSELPEEDHIEVAYSDLLAKPEKTLKKATAFCGYPHDKRFRYYVKFHDIQISNQRTNRNLSNEEAEQLTQAVAAVS